MRIPLFERFVFLKMKIKNPSSLAGDERLAFVVPPQFSSETMPGKKTAAAGSGIVSPIIAEVFPECRSRQQTERFVVSLFWVEDLDP
jgi:hypothetical protein